MKSLTRYQFNTRIPFHTKEDIEFLCEKYSCSQSDLIERLVAMAKIVDEKEKHKGYLDAEFVEIFNIYMRD